MRLGLEAGVHTLDLAVQHGIRGVPIDMVQLATEGVEKTLAPLKARGLEVCQIGAFGFNPLSSDRAEQTRQTALLEAAIPLAAETGCPYLVICGGNYHPSGFGAADPRNFLPSALDKVAEALRPPLRLAEEHGTKLCIEAYLKTAVNSPEAFLALWHKLGSDALRVNIDVTSLFDVRDMWAPERTVEHICTSLAGHYGLGHIKDLALAEGFHAHIDLAPLGSSATDWAQVLRLIKPHLPDDSWLILEHIATPDEAAQSLKRLWDAAEKAGIDLA